MLLTEAKEILKRNGYRLVEFMKLDEAVKVLKKNGYLITEGKYKELIHSQLGELGKSRKQDEANESLQLKRFNKVSRIAKNELTEFVSDLNDELVRDDIILKVEKKIEKVGEFDRAIINFRIKCAEKLYYLISLENSPNSFQFEFIENGFIQSKKHIYIDDDLEVFEKLLSNAMERMVDKFSK